MPPSAADRLEDLNTTFDQKIYRTGGLFVVWCLVCLFIPSLAQPMADCASHLLPSIGKLRQKQSLSPASYIFFGSSALILPFSTAYLAWGTKFRERFWAGQERSGRSKPEFVLMQYLLGLPFVLFVAYLATFAPIEVSEDSRRGRWFDGMLHSQPGLLLIGPFILVMLELALVAALSYVCTPLSSLAAFVGARKQK